MAKVELSDPITLRIPVDVLESIETIAQTCDRTRSWVIVRALRSYLSGEGEDIRAVRRGREQIAAGESHDMDDVLRDLEALMAGKAA